VDWNIDISHGETRMGLQYQTVTAEAMMLEHLTWVATNGLLPPSLTPEQYLRLATEAQQWSKQGVAHYRDGQITDALSNFQQALQAYRTLEQPGAEANVLVAIARLYYGLGDYIWAVDYARQGLAVGRKLNEIAIIQQALNYLGNSYRHLGDLQKALNYMDESLTLAQADGDQAAEMRALNNLALIYRTRSETGMAVPLYETSLRIAEELQDVDTQEQILRNLGNTYHALGDSQRAIEYYDRLLQLARNHSGRPGGEQDFAQPEQCLLRPGGLWPRHPVPTRASGLGAPPSGATGGNANLRKFGDRLRRLRRTAASAGISGATVACRPQLE
jgi:tetratricopeptide (TPR) repeat protein